jgi:hypothetical protein
VYSVEGGWLARWVVGFNPGNETTSLDTVAFNSHIYFFLL